VPNAGLKRDARATNSLARVYVEQGPLDAAITELRHALAVASHDQPARGELHRLLGHLN
jgi:hypothetical protein